MNHSRPGCSYWLVRLLCILLLATSGQATADVVETETLVIGVFPRRPAIESQEMFSPLADYLAQQLGMPTRLEVPADFPAFWRALQAGRFDLVHYNPYHYVRSHQELGYRAIAHNEEQGEGFIRATVWVRRDSGIDSATDLKFHKVIFGGGHKAMVSYIMASDLLHQAGLGPEDYISQFTINPIHAMKALYHRQGAAAGLNYNADKQERLRTKVDFSELKRLLVSEPVAHHPWAISPRVPDGLARGIRDALLSLNQAPGGSDILHQAGLTGLLPAADADYEPHRRIIRRVLGEDYGEPASP